MAQPANNLLATALAYLEADLSVLPAVAAEKRPALRSWKPYQQRLPTEDEVRAWFADTEALCLVTGAVSGHLEMLDFDGGGALYAPWTELVAGEMPGLLDRLVIERSPSGGCHVAYRCEEPIPGNQKLAQRLVDGKPVTLIETRGEGGLFLCDPTPGYRLQQGLFTDLPALLAAERDVLINAARALNEVVPEPEVAPVGSDPCGRPGDEFNERGDMRAVLTRHGWTYVKTVGDNEYWRRPGKDRGWSATLKDRVFYVFSKNAAPFKDETAYGPFSVYGLLEHGGDFEAAAGALRVEGYGSEPDTGDVDLSGILGLPDPGPQDGSQDPGPVPEHLFDVPGLVRTVMDFTLARAPYPNVALAFCGAMALQSYLAGRKVCTPGDLRPNLYLLALAGSGTGKDFPRKVNSRVLFEIGHAGALGDKFASGEGIQDALVRSPAMLFQNDEMDGVLRQINTDRENRRESIPNILLTLYTAASDIYPIRVKAGQKETITVDQPHLTLFGTATPQYFYESLSVRMLTNGFFARLIVIDVGCRGQGQTPGSARHLPDAILETARWWADFRPGTHRANLLDLHPEPKVVPVEPDALQAIEVFQRMTETEYDRAEGVKDEVGRTAWSRTCENAKKLALLYACSENHEDPVIGLPAVEWAAAFAMHQTRRQLYLAQVYVAENPFHAECLKFTRKLREAPDGQMARRDLMRAMRCKAADFDQIVGTLIEQGDIVPVDIPTRTKPARGYRLA